MKIGILTFQNAHNYGALLQAYALKKYLESENHDVEIINYINETIESSYLLPQRNNVKIDGINSLRKWFVRQSSIIKGQKEYKEKWNKFDTFIKKYITSAEKIYRKEDLDINKYDAIVCGSDQIWNTDLTNGFDDVYFANIEGTPIKVAYAASMGKKRFEGEMQEKFVELLKNFDKIATREKELKEYIEEISNVKATTVLDPTLIVDTEIYNEFLHDTGHQNYLLQYTIIDNPILDKIANYIAEKKNLKILEVRYNKRKTSKNRTQILNAGIEDFVSLIHDADFIVTNSFHGTVFSILFKKKFYTIKIKEVNSRIENILNITGLQKRCIGDITEVDFDSNIDFETAEKNIEDAKIESRNYLFK